MARNSVVEYNLLRIFLRKKQDDEFVKEAETKTKANSKPGGRAPPPDSSNEDDDEEKPPPVHINR